MSPVVIGLIGRSGMGKTTLITQLIKRLRDDGLSVAVLKDTHHQVDWDQPGKDSYRFRRVGARAVILRTPQRCIIQQRTRGRVKVERLLPYVQHVDVVLIEGFKNEGRYPKFEVYRPGVRSEKPLYTRIAIQGILTLPEAKIEYSGPRFDLNATADFVAYLQEHFIGKKAS